jgi:N-terminal domain of anti-restriction factor ArdC
MPHERPSEQRNIDWGKVIETALTAPGNMHGVYDRFYSYSFLNQVYLLMQGAREPVATFSRWRSLGRTVLRGSQAKEIIRPLIIEEKQEDGNIENRLVGFKPVKCIFTLSETKGDKLPPVQVPEWDEEAALAKLNVKRVPFTLLNGNIQGASRGREVMINPVAVNPTKTLFHELGHIILGHTMPQTHEEYATHHGIKEFQSEATAYLAMNELGKLDEQTASVSRGYIQSWLDGQRLPDAAIRQVFTATDQILKAGRMAVQSLEVEPSL